MGVRKIPAHRPPRHARSLARVWPPLARAL